MSLSKSFSLSPAFSLALSLSVCISASELASVHTDARATGEGVCGTTTSSGKTTLPKLCVSVPFPFRKPIGVCVCVLLFVVYVWLIKKLSLHPRLCVDNTQGTQGIGLLLVVAVVRMVAGKHRRFSNL